MQDTLQALNDTKVQLEDRSIEQSELMSKHEVSISMNIAVVYSRFHPESPQTTRQCSREAGSGTETCRRSEAGKREDDTEIESRV